MSLLRSHLLIQLESFRVYLSTDYIDSQILLVFILIMTSYSDTSYSDMNFVELIFCISSQSESNFLSKFRFTINFSLYPTYYSQ